jgi:hypothetical protein
MSQFSFEGFIENGRRKSVKFGGGLGLQAIQRVNLNLQIIQVAKDL